MCDGAHSVGRHCCQISSPGPLLFEVDFLQREHVGVHPLHARPQTIQIDSVAHGAPVQDIEGRHSHGYLLPLQSFLELNDPVVQGLDVVDTALCPR